jgi:hypothetical protein
MMMQFVVLYEGWTATQMLEEIARDLAVSGVEVLEVWAEWREVTIEGGRESGEAWWQCKVDWQRGKWSIEARLSREGGECREHY